MTAITLAQAALDLELNVTLGIPTLLVGPVGVGKTDIVRQCAAKLAWPVIDKRASQMDATDVQLPMPDATTGRIVTYVPDWLPRIDRDGEFGILMLDELTDAQLSVQAALNQLILERELPGYRLPDGWQVVGTGNRAQDKAAAQKVSRAMSNRLAVIEIMVDVNAWISWAANVGVSPELIAYIQNANRQGLGSEALHRYPQASGSDAVAFITPRSLARCDRYLKAGLNDTQLRRVLSQNIGDDSANDLMNFLATYRLLPDLNAIIADPMNAPMHREPSVNYALCVALVSKLTMGNLSAIVTYVRRMDTLYQAAFWSMAKGKDQSFETTAEHVAFIVAQSQADAA